MNVESSDVVVTIITLLIATGVGVVWPTIRAYLNAKKESLIQSGIRHALLSYVIYANRTFDDHEQKVAYVLNRAKAVWPNLDTEDVLEQIDTVLEWMERQMDIQVYITGSTKEK